MISVSKAALKLLMAGWLAALRSQIKINILPAPSLKEYDPEYMYRFPFLSTFEDYKITTSLPMFLSSLLSNQYI